MEAVDSGGNAVNNVQVTFSNVTSLGYQKGYLIWLGQLWDFEWLKTGSRRSHPATRSHTLCRLKLVAGQRTSTTTVSSIRVRTTTTMVSSTPVWSHRRMLVRHDR